MGNRRDIRSKRVYSSSDHVNEMEGERALYSRINEQQSCEEVEITSMAKRLRKKPKHNENIDYEEDENLILECQPIVDIKENHLQKEVMEESFSAAGKKIEGFNSDSKAQEKCISKAYNITLELLDMYDFSLIKNQLYLYIEDGGYWKLIPESDANRLIRSIIPVSLCSAVNKSSLYEIYEWLLVNAPKKEEKLVTRQNFMNFHDTALEWDSGKEIKDRKEYLFRYVINLNLDSSKENDKEYFGDFINDVFKEDNDTLNEFKKFFGLCLSDIRWLKLCFFLYGPSNTGKSVLLNVLKHIIGDMWSSSVSFTQMSNEFAVTQLLGKRINLSPEVSGASNKRLDIFKSLTGNDTITACFKGKDHFQFVNEALLVFACNNFPSVQAIDEFDSFLSRIIIFPFKNVIPRDKWIDDLDEKILTNEEEIIRFAVEGLRFLKEDDFCFRESTAMLECKQEFIGLYNSFSIFADKYLEADVNATTTSKQIHDLYVEFCMDENYMVLADNVWPQLLKQKFQCKQKNISGDTGKRVRAYQGIKLKEKMVINPIFRKIL